MPLWVLWLKRGTLPYVATRKLLLLLDELCCCFVEVEVLLLFVFVVVTISTTPHWFTSAAHRSLDVIEDGGAETARRTGGGRDVDCCVDGDGNGDDDNNVGEICFLFCLLFDERAGVVIIMSLILLFLVSMAVAGE